MKLFSLLVILLYSFLNSYTLSQDFEYNCNLELSINGKDLIDNKYPLTRISDIVIMPNNDILILDMDEQTIFCFDSSGVFQKKIGRHGKGPCEFLGPHALELVDSNNILVADNGNRRFSLINIANSEVKIFPFPNEIKILRDFKIDSQRNIYVESIDIKFVNKVMKERTLLSKFNDELEFITYIDSSDYYDGRVRLGPKKILVRVPYPNKLYWNVLPNNTIVVADAHNDVIKFYSSDNNMKTVSLNLSKNILNEKAKRHYYENNIFLEDDGSWGKMVPDYVKKKLIFPKYLPQIYNIIVNPIDENILIQITEYYKGEAEFIYCDFNGKLGKNRILKQKCFNQNTKIRGSYLYTYGELTDEFPVLYKFSIN